MTDASPRALRVLLVEDAPADAVLLVRHLTQAGFSVDSARVENAEAMRQALATGTWDLVLSDHSMPGFDAPAALEVYKSSGLDVPFIVVSGAIGEEATATLMKAGAHDYVLKNNLGRLVPAIQREQHKAASRRERREAHRAQLLERRRMAAINQIVAATTSTLDLQQIIDALLDRLRTFSGADRAAIMLLEPETGQLATAAARDASGLLPTGLRLVRGQGAAGRVLEEAKPLIVPDLRAFPDFVPPHETGASAPSGVSRAMSYAGFPLVSRGRIVGVASLVGTTPREFPPDEVAFIGTICRATAVGIDNAMAHEELHRRAEKLTGEIAAQRSYAENVLGSITDGVVTVDANKRIVSWNKGAEAIMGYTAEEAIGKLCSEVFHDLCADGKPACQTMACAFDDIERAGQPCPRREVASARRNGEPVALSIRAAPIFDERGRFQGIVHIFHDFSREQELLDGIQRANRTKSMFLANMSHEIRTPLNAILGFSQILLKAPAISEKHRQQLDVINRSGEHLLALIDGILDMAKIDAGRAPLAPTTFTVSGLLSDLTSMFRLRAESKGLDFAVTVADGVPAVLLADEKKLRQILINLVSNAVKFTARGSVKCGVAVRREADGGMRLVVDVEDTGLGVPAGAVEGIFHPFEQTAVGAGAGGTGLGLAISREFARIMGGDILLESEEGRGSRFRLDVPVAVGRSGRATPVGMRRRVVGIHPGVGPLNALVVDDQPENRMVLVEMLKAVGYGTREAAGGEEAIAVAIERAPDAVLMDVRMPGMDGLEAIQRLRAIEALRRTPIIAVSASAFEANRQQFQHHLPG